MKKSIIALTVSVLFLAACMPGCGGSTRQPAKPPPPLKPDIEFARDTFLRLVKGDPAVEDMIDWETLKVFNSDPGSTYSYMPGESARAAFRKSFIQGFSQPFRNSGELPGWLTTEGRWRIESKELSKTTVVADYPAGKVLVLTISLKDGWQKLSSITGR
ncbi:MAG TPA: hypothetical protein VN643_10885 [Pyrinomonadaceae bacterium]|nr:hypothetical protein [Pyrinomonadaceae bacterium]